MFIIILKYNGVMCKDVTCSSTRKCVFEQDFSVKLCYKELIIYYINIIQSAYKSLKIAIKYA